MIDGTTAVTDRQAGRGPTSRLALAWRHWCSTDRLNWALIGIGILLRIAQYAADRSLWYDESFLALNIVNRSLGGLLRPLDHGQGAPIGFLMLEKLLVQRLGDSEYVLRLIPFLSGLIALLLFYRVARDIIRPGAVPIALGLFAILDPLIHYASELKQYSSDVAVTLALLWSAQMAFGRRGALSVPRALIFGLIGAAALWFSHPATFVLMGVGTAVLVVAYRDGDWIRIGRFSMAALIWIVSLGGPLLRLPASPQGERRTPTGRTRSFPFPLRPPRCDGSAPRFSRSSSTRSGCLSPASESGRCASW